MFGLKKGDVFVSKQEFRDCSVSARSWENRKVPVGSVCILLNDVCFTELGRGPYYSRFFYENNFVTVISDNIEMFLERIV